MITLAADTSSERNSIDFSMSVSSVHGLSVAVIVEVLPNQDMYYKLHCTFKLQITRTFVTRYLAFISI